jgi:cell division cycle 14
MHSLTELTELFPVQDEPVEFRTNCAFLLAAFMMIELKYTPEQAWLPFSKIGSGAFATFRDATYCEQDYHLTIKACLEGLYKAMQCGWYNPVNFDSGAYQYLDAPDKADMHIVSPKFVAFKGPSDARRNSLTEAPTFTPRHYSEVFRDEGVTAVVRLNEPTTYKKERFEREGFRHYDLYFDDCTVPSREIVDKFFSIAEQEEGKVAVHCRAGLGRTGTLIAIYFMKHYGWTASECIGWLRIVRPGSIIGPQQQYLHWAETVYGQGASPSKSAAAPPLPPPVSLEESQALGRQVAEAQVRRQIARVGVRS